jgi:hypothetical protein
MRACLWSWLRRQWHWFFFKSTLDLFVPISILENITDRLPELRRSDNTPSCHVPDEVQCFIQFPFLAQCVNQDFKCGFVGLDLLVMHPAIDL